VSFESNIKSICQHFHSLFSDKTAAKKGKTGIQKIEIWQMCHFYGLFEAITDNGMFWVELLFLKFLGTRSNPLSNGQRR